MCHQLSFKYGGVSPESLQVSKDGPFLTISSISEKSLIEREIQKQRAHIPFRQLLKRAGRALRDMKPCYMLSPISLSQIVSPEPEIFDVLIIDSLLIAHLMSLFELIHI